MSADRLPARRCGVALADVAHGQRRDGFPQPVVRGKDAVVAVAVLPRRRHEVRESGNYDLGRGLRRRQKNATEAGAGRFEKPAPDARAAPPEDHESLISRKTGAEVPLTGLSLLAARMASTSARILAAAASSLLGCQHGDQLDSRRTDAGGSVAALGSKRVHGGLEASGP